MLAAARLDDAIAAILMLPLIRCYADADDTLRHYRDAAITRLFFFFRYAYFLAYAFFMPL